MNKYLLFTYDKYYPCGGMDDFRNSYDTIEECIDNLDKDLYHIIERDTFKLVNTNDEYLEYSKNH